MVSRRLVLVLLTLGVLASLMPLTADARRKRPGCGTFCRQAGGFGGGPDTKEPVHIGAQRIRVDRDGIIAIRATCLRSVTCDGAILIDSLNSSKCCVYYGRADFRVPAHATRRVEVGVPARAVRYLRRHGSDRGFATVALKAAHTSISISGRLTILAPR